MQINRIKAFRESHLMKDIDLHDIGDKERERENNLPLNVIVKKMNCNEILDNYMNTRKGPPRLQKFMNCRK